jgi:hypothetical protein
VRYHIAHCSEAHVSAENLAKTLFPVCYMTDKCLSWTDCVDVCTDGAQSMMGKMCGFIAYVKAIAPKCTNFHCIIIPYSLDVEKVTNALKRVLDEAVKIVKFIKSRPLHSNFQCPLWQNGWHRSQSLIQVWDFRFSWQQVPWTWEPSWDIVACSLKSRLTFQRCVLSLYNSVPFTNFCTCLKEEFL